MMSDKFYHNRPWLPWQRNLGRNWLLLRLYERYLRDPCVYQGVFWVGLLNDVSQILPRQIVVAMATKFELILAISRLILSPRSWRLSVCNKWVRSTLHWSQSKIFLVMISVSCVNLTKLACVNFEDKNTKAKITQLHCETQKLAQRL